MLEATCENDRLAWKKFVILAVFSCVLLRALGLFIPRPGNVRRGREANGKSCKDAAAVQNGTNVDLIILEET